MRAVMSCVFRGYLTGVSRVTLFGQTLKCVYLRGFRATSFILINEAQV